MRRGEQDRTLATTEQSLAVATLVKERNGATLGEVSDGLGVAKSTAYNHLRTLERLGFLRKEGDQYHIGLQFMDFGEYARHRKAGYRVAAVVVDALAADTGEEVDFFVENAGKAMTVQVSYDVANPFDETVDASENHWRVGTCYNIHGTAGGKAILSGFDDERVRSIADRHGLEPNTDRTITDVELLLKDLETVRETGFSISEEEYTEGLCAVARRVDEPDGSVLGALAVNIPKYRFESALPDVKSHLAAAADELMSRLVERRHAEPG